MLCKGDRIGIVCCSDGHRPERKRSNKKLDTILRAMGLEPVWSDCIYAVEDVFSGSGKDRAEAVNRFCADETIKAIFDISGGNIANNVLEYLNYDLIRANPKSFVGYSDLTTVLNAIYAKTGNPGILWQMRHLAGQDCELQQRRFLDTFFEKKETLFDARYTFIKGKAISGTVVGGNVRCLLKLAGTPYWPDCTGKVLFLESLGGGAGEIAAMAVQLRQMGVFEQISGLLLGTFTKMEQDSCTPTAAEIFRKAAEQYNFPIAQTKEIGHGTDSKALRIGQELTIRKQEAIV